MTIAGILIAVVLLAVVYAAWIKGRKNRAAADRRLELLARDAERRWPQGAAPAQAQPDRHVTPVSARSTPPPSPPPRPTVLRHVAPVSSAPPPWLDHSDDDQFDITYSDSDGVLSDRRIRVTSVEAFGDRVYVRALCALRGEERTFRADRIIHARMARGSPIAGPSSYFAGHVPADARPNPEHDKVMARVRNGLRVLVWIAHSDRDISTDEMEVLLDFIEERSRMAARGPDVPWSRNKAIAQIENERPTLALVAGYLAGMSRTGKEFPLIRSYSERLSAIGGIASEKRMKQLFR